MTVRTYFDGHPNFKPGGAIETRAGIDDALWYCGVPVDAVVFDMIKTGNYDAEIPEPSMVRLRELGGFCG